MIVEKVLIVACVVGMLLSSKRYRSMSRELDETALLALKRFISAAEETGDQQDLIPLLMLLTALLMLATVVTQGAVR